MHHILITQLNSLQAVWGSLAVARDIVQPLESAVAGGPVKDFQMFSEFAKFLQLACGFHVR